MNVRAIPIRDLPPAERPPTDPDAFLRWAVRQERKYELAGGNVMMMVQVTKAHALISGRLAALLVAALEDKPFQVSSAGFGVRTHRGVRYPDIVVDRLEGDPGLLSAVDPVVIAEVLSSSSYETDFVLKAEEYRAIASVRHYLILAQDEPRVWLSSRGDGGGWPEASTMIEGHEGTVEVPDLGLSLPMAKLYRGFRAITD